MDKRKWLIFFQSDFNLNISYLCIKIDDLEDYELEEVYLFITK
jgi:hypothetical protein